MNRDQDKKPLSGCSTAQIQRLMEHMTAGDGAASLPARAAKHGDWRNCLDLLCQNESESGDLLLGMLCAPETDDSTLRSIKERSKRLVKSSSSSDERSASMLLYHGAIAAAYANHGTEISSRPIANSIPLFADLAGTLGADPLGQVFAMAQKRFEFETD